MYVNTDGGRITQCLLCIIASSQIKNGRPSLDQTKRRKKISCAVVRTPWCHPLNESSCFTYCKCIPMMGYDDNTFLHDTIEIDRKNFDHIKPSLANQCELIELSSSNRSWLIFVIKKDSYSFSLRIGIILHMKKPTHISAGTSPARWNLRCPIHIGLP